ncbi:MAG: hypothetical protein HOW73_00535 [Polyangiaceae bacterium]|nr:hypothetical protein [Polyangiaceae bacterium]
MNRAVALLTLSLVVAGCDPSEPRHPDGPPGGPLGGPRDGGREGPPRRRAPPKEAVEACADLDDGETCSFRDGEHEIQGTCDAPPDEETLACRPNGPPPGGPHGPPPPGGPPGGPPME